MSATLPTHAITLYQPYAWLVVHGHKPIENRPRRSSVRSFRGPFWVHAGLVRDADVWDDARGHCDRILGKGFRLPPLDELTFGAILGRARITGVHLPLDASIIRREPEPWHFPDQYGLIVKEPRAPCEPVAARGYQHPWRVPEAQMAELLKRTEAP